jgi:homoserine trans-succinylase
MIISDFHTLHYTLFSPLLLHLLHTHVDYNIVWAAQAGAKRVYAIEYTAMANHARRVVQANGVDHIVTVIQGAVEDVILPEEDWDGVGLAQEEGDVEFNDDGRKNQRVVDIILSG